MVFFFSLLVVNGPVACQGRISLRDYYYHLSSVIHFIPIVQLLSLNLVICLRMRISELYQCQKVVEYMWLAGWLVRWLVGG